MATIAEIRQQYPQYSDMSDMQLARALHAKNYSDMEFGTFARKIGMLDEPAASPVSDYRSVRESGTGPALTRPVEYRTALEGAGKFFTDVGLGARQLIRSSPYHGGQISGDPKLTAEAQTKREVDAPLMETGAGRAGFVGTGILSTVPAMAIPGANTTAGAAAIGGAYGALQPTVSGRERLINTGTGAAVAGATQFVGNRIANWASQRLTNRATEAATRQAQNAVRDMTLAEARQAGYVVPPSAVNPSAANVIAESIPGKAATAQAASYRNQQITNSLARQALGLPDNAPLTTETLGQLRANAGNVYEAVKNSGRIAVDWQYIDDLANMTSAIDEVAKDFPQANVGSSAEVKRLVDSLWVERFDSRSAVEYVKQLRADATANLSGAAAANPANKALGLAQREAAGALEDMLVRHLESTGKGGLANAFDEARTLIAKTYSVQGALNESSGNVIASQLGTQLKKGKPLSGELETIARFSRAFRPYTQEVIAGPGVSNLDAAVTTIGAAAAHPAVLAYPVGRAIGRASVLSGPYQNALARPNYMPGPTFNALLESLKFGGQRAALPASVLGVQAVQQ